MLKVPDAFQKLINSVESTMRHAIVEEEHIPFDTVTNFDEVMNLPLKNKQRFLNLMFSEVVDQGWKKDVEAKSLETVDLSGLVLREAILPQ